jgi:SNF2 family DNA or RNA helicase
VVWYSATWSRELWDQANARIYRDGQAEPVFVHRLIVEDTVDEVQARVLDQRGDLAAAVRDLVALV